MNKANSIAPFPTDIDRTAFGHWFTGFADGESCFTIFKYKARLRRGSSRHEINRKATFAICLRADDADILLRIQSFFGCGDICHSRQSYLRGQMNPWVRWSVRKIGDLANIVIPHFEKFPLRTKKARDFEIWKQGVAIMMEVRTRTVRGPYRWLPNDDVRFDSLIAALKQGHVYNPHDPIHQKPVTSKPWPCETLFDS
jgi:hypothetical protein